MLSLRPTGSDTATYRNHTTYPQRANGVFYALLTVALASHHQSSRTLLTVSMRELRPLRLPQLLEARRKEDANMSPESQCSQATTSSSLPSPVTPTFSLRGHGRFPSSTSSPASSPVMRESMDGFSSGKRPLTEVKEEPLEREDDYDMVGGLDSPDYDCKLKPGPFDGHRKFN